MKPHLSRVAKLGGSLGVFALASTIDPSGGFIAKILEAVTGNLASNFIGQYDPEALLAYLDKHDPEYNHDIERLMIDSVPKAVKLVVAKYKNENPYQDRFVDKTLKELVNYAEVKPYNQADEHLMLTDREAWLDTIHEYIFMGGEDEEGKRTEIENFFVDNLAQCYELVFTEGLKDEKDEKPLKAFLIKTLNGLASQMETSAWMQQQLLKEVKALKAEKPSRTLPVGRAYFEEHFRQIHVKLDRLDDKVETILKNTEILIESQKNIKIQLPKQLTVPPFRPEVFLGREQELADIKKELSEGDHLLLINGEGGVGKTSLVSNYYHSFQDEYTHVCWLLCNQGISNAMISLAQVLNLTFEDTMLADERLQGVIRALTELDRPGLMVLDNANDLDDLDANYENLRRCSNFHILLTTRIDNYRQARQYSLEGLPEDEALGLFNKYYPNHQKEDDGLFRQLYNAVGQNTLVVELMAKNLDRINKLRARYRLGDLLADLQSKGVLGLSQQKEVQVDYQKFKKATPEEIIAAMYDLGELSGSEAELLSIFAVLPAEGMSFEVLEVLIPDTDWLEDTLLMLAQKGWLSTNENSYKCSPVVQDIVRRKKTNLLETCLPFINILNNKLDHEPGTGVLLNCTTSEEHEFIPLAESLLTNVKGAVVELGNLCETIGNYYYYRGYLEKAYIYFKRYNNISLQESFENDLKDHLAFSHERLGYVEQDLGNMEGALEHYQKYNQLMQELYSDFPTQVNFKFHSAISHEKLGDVEQDLGNMEGALEHYQKYNQLTQELYNDFPTQVNFKNYLAFSHERLGYVEQDLGNMEGALEHYQKYNQLMQELYSDFPTQARLKFHLAISHERLGYVEKELGNMEGALEHYQKYNQLTQELYNDFPTQVSLKHHLAFSHERLGYVEQDLGNMEGALEHYQKYNQLMQELYSDFPTQVNFKDYLALSHERLGYVEQDLGNMEGALEHYQKYNQLMQELYSDFPTQVRLKQNLAISFYGLGEWEKGMGNMEGALEHYQKYNQLTQELYSDFPTQVNFKDYLALSHERLGYVEQDLGNMEGALEHYQKYNQLMQELYSDFPTQVRLKQNLAISFYGLGEWEKGMGNMEGALEHYQKYNQLMQELYSDFPTQVSLKHHLALSHERLGYVEQDLGNMEGALEHYQKYNQLMQELYNDFPTQVNFKDHLALSHGELGEVKKGMGNMEGALEHYQKYNQLMQELYSDFPTQVNFKDHLALSHGKLGEVEKELGNMEGALEHYQKYNQLMQEFYTKFPSHIGVKNNLSISYEGLGEVETARGNVKAACNNYLKAEQLWRELVEQIPDVAEYQKSLKRVRGKLDRLGCNGSSGGLNSI